MITLQQIRASEREDEVLRTASVTIIEGAAIPEQRNLPGPLAGRLSSKEGAEQAAFDYEGSWGWV